jgi:hypothetical protein
VFPITAILLYTASYQRFKQIKWLFYAGLLLYSLTTFSQWSINNLIIMISLVLTPLFIQQFKKINMLGAIFAPVIWSIIIDTLYYWFIWQGNIPYLHLIYGGILFNLSNIIWPTFITSFIFLIDYISKPIIIGIHDEKKFLSRQT